MAFFSRLRKEQEQKLTEFVDSTMHAQIAALQTLIGIPSLKAPPEDGLPFGAPMQQALDASLRMAQELGFETRDLDGYVGIVEAGEGEETLGVLAHLDIVPAGEGWSLPPFSGQVRDGNVYGRGAIDDKGPAISALYALAAVRAAGIPLKRKVQVILGCDEESGWACMDRFKKTEPLPTLSFSPDAVWPLVYSEATILQATFRLPLTNSRVRAHAGERGNVIPGTAEAFVPFTVTSLPKREGFSIKATPQDGGTKLEVTGLGGHAAMPESGKNAMQFLLQALKGLQLDEQDAAAVNTLANALQMDMHGETLGIDVTDESGRLTFNPGVLRYDADGVSLTFDSRIPHSLSADEVLARVTAALCPAGFVLQGSPRIQKGHLVSRESELVQKLMGVYRAHTGDHDAQPLAIGGGTYARAMGNAVAFGCEWPNLPMTAHMPDEFISLEDLKSNTLIFADAIAALAGEGQD